MYVRSFFIALLVTFFVTNLSFGACNWVSQSYFREVFNHGSCSVSFSQGCGNDYTATAGTSCDSGCSDISISITGNMSSYPYYCSSLRVNTSLCNYSFGQDRIDYSILRCGTKLEADSASCDLQGGTWNGTSCVQGDTTSCATYKAQCEQAGGKFEGTTSDNGGCNAVCDVCQSDALKKLQKAQNQSCCNQNLLPPELPDNMLCYPPVRPVQNGMNISSGCILSQNCACELTLDENMNFDYLKYSQKCGSAEGGQDPNSSASEGGSSSSSSASDSSSVPPQVQVLGLEGLMDSLHKIIYNTAEVDTTTTFMLMCMQNPELYCPSLLGSSSSGDTIIIEGDTTIVNVPSDSAIIAEVSENIKNQGARTRNRLDSLTKELLDSMSQSDSAYRAFDSSANYHRDSLLGIIGAMQIVEGNETQALLDSVKGKLEGVIGELAGFGDKLDSLELNLPDTTIDLGGSDTAIIRRTIDSLGEWVGGLISPDSAGGWGSQNSDGSYGDGSGYGFGIKKGANDSLGSQLGVVIGGIVDTGAVADILDTMQKWQDAFNFGDAASSGGCPSILTREYQVNIGEASFSVPPIGQYLCSPIAGLNTTMWDIGRMVLRALVSIMCFLWLFRICMTEGKGDD